MATRPMGRSAGALVWAATPVASQAPRARLAGTINRAARGFIARIVPGLPRASIPHCPTLGRRVPIGRTAGRMDQVPQKVW